MPGISTTGVEKRSHRHRCKSESMTPPPPPAVRVTSRAAMHQAHHGTVLFGDITADSHTTDVVQQTNNSSAEI